MTITVFMWMVLLVFVSFVLRAVPSAHAQAKIATAKVGATPSQGKEPAELSEDEIKKRQDIIAPYVVAWRQTNPNVRINAPVSLAYFNAKISENGYKWQINKNDIDRMFGSKISHVYLTGLGPDSVGIKIHNSSGNDLSDVHINNMKTGIDMDNANKNRLHEIFISGQAPEKPTIQPHATSPNAPQSPPKSE